MKVTLIGQSFDKKSGQGIYKFSEYLYQNLRKINKDVKKIKLGISRNPCEAISNNILKPLYLTRNVKADIYHFMAPETAFPAFLKRPSIVTFHDVIPLKIQERKRTFNTYFKILSKIACYANHIICVSESTKKDLIKTLGVPKKKIKVIYEGVDHEKLFPLKLKKEKEKFIVGYLGGLSKRKNVETILKVAKKLENQKEITFKIAGNGPELNNLLKIKKQLKISNVDFIGFIPEKKLNEFYNSLDIFIFPSLYEGFGLPVLEAMACKIPVITSNISSMPEIAEGASLLVNPKSVEEISNQIKRLLKERNLRKKLSEKGFERSKKFTWKKCALEHLKIYKSLRIK